MTDHTIIDLPEIRLPRDLAWRVKFIEAVDEHVRYLGIAGRFEPPRFFGYYFAGMHPVVLAGHWKVTLDSSPLLWRLRAILERMTENQFNIAAKSADQLPEFMLVHDRHDGSCWLWGFNQGRRFLEAHEPIENTPENAEGPTGEENRRILGP